MICVLYVHEGELHLIIVLCNLLLASLTLHLVSLHAMTVKEEILTLLRLKFQLTHRQKIKGADREHDLTEVRYTRAKKEQDWIANSDESAG